MERSLPDVPGRTVPIRRGEARLAKWGDSTKNQEDSRKLRERIIIVIQMTVIWKLIAVAACSLQWMSQGDRHTLAGPELLRRRQQIGIRHPWTVAILCLQFRICHLYSSVGWRFFSSGLTAAMQGLGALLTHQKNTRFR